MPNNNSQQWDTNASTNQRTQRDKDSLEANVSTLAGGAVSGIHSIQFLIDELKAGRLCLTTMATGLGMSETALKSYFKRVYGTTAFSSLTYRQKMETINYQINKRFCVPVTLDQEKDMKLMLRRIALAKVTQGIAAMDEQELVRFFGSTLLKDALEEKPEEKEIDYWSKEEAQLFEDKVKNKKIAPIVKQGNEEFVQILTKGQTDDDEKAQKLLKERDEAIKHLRSLDEDDEVVGESLDSELGEPAEGENTIPGLD